MIRTTALLFACALAAAAAHKRPEVLKRPGDVEDVPDPVIIKQKDTYYVFCTGGGRGGTAGIMPIRTSKDLIHRTNAGNALPGVPEWASRRSPARAAPGPRTFPITKANITSITPSPPSAAATPPSDSPPTPRSMPPAPNTPGPTKA